MPIPVLDAAKYVCSHSGWAFSNLKIQKMLYLAQMVHQGAEGAPLVDGDFEAWRHGPVHMDLYYDVKHCGASPIRSFHFPDGVTGDIGSGTEREVLDVVIKRLGPKGGLELVALTQMPGGAWEMNWDPALRGAVIPHADMTKEYDLRIALHEHG